MKVVTILGARPQFIKASTVSRALASAGIHELIVHTGQHFDANMSDIFFTQMDIPKPYYQLEINSLSHGAMTGRMMERIEEVLLKEKPELVLVYGDTNSTLAGALAATKLHVPVAHVEAGLRSFEMKMPEEINRILTDRVSTLLYCPTKTAVYNLTREGFENFDCKIEQPGDVMFDSALYYKGKVSPAEFANKLKLAPGNFVLATLHRAENTSGRERFESICAALNKVNEKIPVVLPLHPGTKKLLADSDVKLNVKIIEPVGYLEMLALLQVCSLVMTDSGGLQKEAYFFGKFCVTLRDQTEWIELVEAGANVIAGSGTERIVDATMKNLNRKVDAGQLFGSGDASKRIAASIAQFSR